MDSPTPHSRPSSTSWPSTLASASSSPAPEDTEHDGEQPPLTPMELSLLRLVQNPRSPTFPGLIESLPTPENGQPRNLPNMGDSAQYFVRSDGQLLTFVFPAAIDQLGRYSGIDAYFNLGKQALDAAALKKARATFELRELVAHDLPDEAVKTSQAMMKTLFVLHKETEDQRNGSLAPSKQPAVTPFWRTYTDANEHYSFVVQSDLLFSNIPDPKKAPIPVMTRGDIAKETGPLSPSKAKAQKLANESVSGNTLKGIRDWKLANLADPDGRYSQLPSDCRFETSVNVPDVRDGHGALIHPQHYAERLRNGTIVAVEIFLKLWTISARPKLELSASSKFKPREGEENGSRIYQLILRRMQVLPIADFSKDIFVSQPSTPSKRKGKDDPKGKKKANTTGSDPFVDDMQT